MKIYSAFDAGAYPGLQEFRVVAAVLLFAPFLVLIFLSIKPQLLSRKELWRGSWSVAAMAFTWFFCALFLSLLAGFAF
jgi:hypothetical protein